MGLDVTPERGKAVPSSSDEEAPTPERQGGRHKQGAAPVSFFGAKNHIL